MRRLLALLVLVAACQNEHPPAAPAAAEKPKAPPLPTVAAATTLIGGSAELGEFEFTNAGYSLPVAASMRSAPANDVAEDLAAAGWIAIDGTGNISLTAKSAGDRRFLQRANGILDIVPLGKKEMGEVGAIRANDDGSASADFTWRWIPNEVGSSIQRGPVAERFSGEQKSTAVLLWDGTSWSALKIERR